MGPLADPAVTHDITSGYTKPLLDPIIDVTEKPVFITYTAPNPETPIHLHADTSPADLAWLILIATAIFFAAHLRVPRSTC